MGVYIRLKHNSSPSCQYQQWQEKELENFERLKDEDEMNSGYEVPRDPFPGLGVETEIEEDVESAAADFQFMKNMDSLYEGAEPNDIPDMMMEEDDDHGTSDPEADVGNDELGINGTATSAAVPRTDGLHNSYVRIVHTNGVHHLALVTCSCSGYDGLPAELIHAGLMPTSFRRVRTLFSLAVLDQYRYSNLEMKASAYQFYQMLRRVTLPMSPTSVVNFYHELRRLSRLWRWMKKLKWAGFGHKEADPMNVSPGELSNFCPACPQPGINLPEDWQTDKNRWVYR